MNTEFLSIPTADHIVVTSPIAVPVPTASDPTDDEASAFIAEMRELLAGLGSKVKKHDRMIILITCCIEQSFDTGCRITGIAARLGFNKQHAGIILTECIGDRWERGEDGQFILI